MEQSRTKMVVEAGLAIALTYILHYITLYKMPQGGSIDAASLVPLLFFSYRWGGKSGILAATAYGLLHFLLGAKYSIQPLSILFDYILGYGVIGVAGFFRGSYGKALLGGCIAIFLRYVSSVLSGAIVFYSYAPKGVNVWFYSITYNATYMVPVAIVNLIVVALFYKKIVKPVK